MNRASTFSAVLVSSLLAAGPMLSAQQQAAAASSTAPVPGAAPAANYVIGPKDVLTITIFGEPDLTGKTYAVDADGKFSFPMVGRVQAGGRTVAQLEEELRKKLTPDFFRNPQISIGIDQYLSKQIIVTGEVAQPGPQPYTGGLTLLGVLAKAGGAKPTAAGEVLVAHGRGVKTGAGSGTDASDPNVQFDGTRIDLLKLQAGDLSLDIEIKDGDTVLVPRAEGAYVIGEVKNPGSYPVQKGATLQQILSLAGGTTPDASEGNISIDRGGKTIKKVKPTDAVLPGDTIKVPARFF